MPLPPPLSHRPLNVSRPSSHCTCRVALITSHLSRRSRHIALAVSPSPCHPRCVAFATSPWSHPPFATHRGVLPLRHASPSPCRVVFALLPHRVTPITLSSASCALFFFLFSLFSDRFLLSQVRGGHLPPANMRDGEAATTSRLPVPPPKPHSRRRRRRIPFIASPSHSPHRVAVASSLSRRPCHHPRHVALCCSLTSHRVALTTPG